METSQDVFTIAKLILDSNVMAKQVLSLIVTVTVVTAFEHQTKDVTMGTIQVAYIAKLTKDFIVMVLLAKSQIAVVFVEI